jgi:hypothetical protein
MCVTRFSVFLTFILTVGLSVAVVLRLKFVQIFTFRFFGVSQ